MSLGKDWVTLSKDWVTLGKGWVTLNPPKAQVQLQLPSLLQLQVRSQQLTSRALAPATLYTRVHSFRYRVLARRDTASDTVHPRTPRHNNISTEHPC